jgi:hypothetical protein
VEQALACAWSAPGTKYGNTYTNRYRAISRRKALFLFIKEG